MKKAVYGMTAPRKSTRVDHLTIKGDRDLWVEKKGRLADGTERSYFKSVKTKRCFIGEPPTGASQVVYLCEIHNYSPELQAFALGSSHEQVRRRGKRRDKPKKAKPCALGNGIIDTL